MDFLLLVPGDPVPKGGERTELPRIVAGTKYDWQRLTYRNSEMDAGIEN